MIHPEGFPNPEEFPNYDNIDSQSVVESAEDFDIESADFDAEPEHCDYLVPEEG